MSTRTDRLSTYLGTCPATGKRMYAEKGDAKKAKRALGESGTHAYRCDACDHFHWGHARGRSRAEIRGEVVAPEPVNVPQPMSHLQALAAAYNLDPTPSRWNALMKALHIPADRAPMRGPDPTATTAIARVDRERKSS